MNPSLILIPPPSTSPYTNSYISSLYPSFGFRGLENYGNYVDGGISNSYNYGNFGNFSPSIFSPFPGTALLGLYGGGVNRGLYQDEQIIPTFSPGIFSPLSSNISMNPLSLGQWNTPSVFPGSIFPGGNTWPGISNIWSTPYPGGQYPYPYPYPSPSSRTSSGLTIIRTNTDGLLEERIRDALGLEANETITTAKALSLTSSGC